MEDQTISQLSIASNNNILVDENCFEKILIKRILVSSDIRKRVIDLAKDSV